MRGLVKFLVSSIVILAAVGVFVFKYWQYVTNPWTRDGQIRAQVIQITPRVTAPIEKLPIMDNQFVKAGDLLFEIDRRTFKASVAQAQADLAEAMAKVAEAKDEADRIRRIRAKDPGAMSERELIARQNEQRGAEAAVLGAQAALDESELDLEFTRVKAPVDGYVTNLDLRLGSQAVANQPALALVDVNSYWVHGYFKENVIAGIEKGDRAVVTLMTYPDQPLEGLVDSIGWGISQDDGSTGYDLLPSISATFEWIRLAQRVPVRIHLLQVPEEIKLRVGTTCSVLVMKGTAGTESKSPPVAAPAALQ